MVEEGDCVTNAVMYCIAPSKMETPRRLIISGLEE